MDLLRPKKLDELILSFLLKGEISTTLLLSEIRKTKKGVTKQGFYAALRKLKKEDIVITYSKKASLNTTWLKEMRDTFTSSQTIYTSENTSSDFLSLADKESVVYNFSTIKNMDTFWGHTWNVLTSAIPSTEPLYIYDPHYWFYIARRTLERKFQKEITDSKRSYLMIVAGTTALDKAIRKDFVDSRRLIKYNQQRVFVENNYYITIIGDYIAETHLDPRLSQKIEDIFIANNTITDDVVIELQDILNLQIKSKLKISRNRFRAEKLKRKLGAHFSTERERM